MSLTTTLGIGGKTIGRYFGIEIGEAISGANIFSAIARFGGGS